MTTRIALLRGINLGAHNKVPMARLRDLAAEIGLSDVRTYAQSGNMVFETDLDEIDVVVNLGEAIADRFGLEVQVISRSAQEIRSIAGGHPFDTLDLDDRLLHVAFLSRETEQDPHDLIEVGEYAPDVFEARGREIYLAYPDGSGRSRLNHALLERRLGVPVTLRNWRTVSKLAEMVS